MTPDSVGPLSRPVNVSHLPAEGLAVAVEASAEERELLAHDFKLAEVRSLKGDFHLSGTAARIKVTGRVSAEIKQICVVTLDPFDSRVEEEVEVDFEADPGSPEESQSEREPADAIVGGQIDLGALSAEFLALGLDPYPRKPGADFGSAQPDEPALSPFAALKKLTERR